MSWTPLLLAGLFGAGLLAGVLNPTTGSGNLASFVILTAGLGIPAFTAHVANQAAAPASFAVAWRQARREHATWRTWWRPMVAGCVGTLLGTVLLAQLSPGWVSGAAPWGLLAGAALLLAGPLAQTFTTRHRVPLLLLAGLYGGTIGAGVGTLVLACVDAVGRGAAVIRNALCLSMGAVVTLSLIGASVAHPGLLQPVLALDLAGGMLVGGLLGSRVLAWLLRRSPLAPAWIREAVAIVAASAAAGMLAHQVLVALGCVLVGALVVAAAELSLRPVVELPS